MIRRVKISGCMSVRMIVWTACIFLLHSCFTGIESTPKITANDVKKENIQERKENSFLADIGGENIGDWGSNKRFYVTDDRISILFGPTYTSKEGLKGTVLRFVSAKDVSSITDEPVAELTFLSTDGLQLKYRTDKSLKELKEQGTMTIPFTIEESIVDAVRNRIKGHKYYVMTSMWYDMNDQSLTGQKFIPVTVEEVLPGNSVYPVKVILGTDEGKRFGLFMTTGSNQKAPRGFGSLFSFTNPHLRYPTITDETWKNIINGRVAVDMSREECRLALGSPASVSRQTGYDYLHEIWTYENGIYLVFRDGLLINYRR